MANRSAEQPGESLVERVNRAKARWLRRVMYDRRVNSTEKCFAFVVSDHLNCVTLDCWPAQPRLTELLGCQSIKTPQRVALGLARLGLITIRHSRKARTRYAPVFRPDDDGNTGVRGPGHPGAGSGDINVHQSYLEILPESSSTEAVADGGRSRPPSPRSYNPRQRGAFEGRVAEMLGRDGFEVLGRLASLDDAIVERLCRACAEGTLGERELLAARLAAEQM